MAVGRVFPNEIDRVLYYPGGPIGKEVRALSLQIANNASVMAATQLGKNPMDKPRTGKYRDSFKVRVVGRTTEFQVSNNQKYAAALETGAKPHEIRAKRSRTLHFKDRQGRWRRLKIVRHPGNPAFHILEKAAILSMDQRYGKFTVV